MYSANGNERLRVQGNEYRMILCINKQYKITQRNYFVSYKINNYVRFTYKNEQEITDFKVMKPHIAINKLAVDRPKDRHTE